MKPFCQVFLPAFLPRQRASQHGTSVPAGRPGYQAIAVRSQYKPVHNMVNIFSLYKYISRSVHVDILFVFCICIKHPPHTLRPALLTSPTCRLACICCGGLSVRFSKCIGCLTALDEGKLKPFCIHYNPTCNSGVLPACTSKPISNPQVYSVTHMHKVWR